MSTQGLDLATNQGNVLAFSLAVNAPTPAPQAVVSPEAEEYAAFELANATILASALGLGVYIDTFM
jgi:hypothetical protein